MLSKEVMQNFMDAIEYVREHPMMHQRVDGCVIGGSCSDFYLGMFDCICVDVVCVNPETLEIDDDKEKNTRIRVWIEFGFPEYENHPCDGDNWYSTHDIDLDVGADTFEEAIIALAEKIKQKYDK